MRVADESCAGSRSFQPLGGIERHLTGYQHIILTHPGRTAERILFSLTVRPGNDHFDATRGNIENGGGEARDLAASGCAWPFRSAPTPMATWIHRELPRGLRAVISSPSLLKHSTDESSVG